VIAADPLSIATDAGWYFYALGPQLAVCLLLGCLTARRSSGSLLNWLVVAFFAAMLPLVGVVVMLVFWWRAGAGPRSAAGGPPAETRAGEPPA